MKVGGYLDQSLMLSEKVEAEVGFDSAIALTSSRQKKAMDKISKDSYKLYFKADAKNRVEEESKKQKKLVFLQFGIHS